jgi:hypothetical protein
MQNFIFRCDENYFGKDTETAVGKEVRGLHIQGAFALWRRGIKKAAI